MESWIKRFKDYSTSLDSVEVSSAKQRKELPQYKKHSSLKMRSLSNYGNTKNSERILGSVFEEFGVEPVPEEKGEDYEEEKHKIHKFKLFLDKKEDLLFRTPNNKNWPKTRSKSTEMMLPKVDELGEEEKPYKDLKRKFSVRKSNRWLTDKSERIFEFTNLKHLDSKSLFNAESNITIKEEDQSYDDEDSDKDTISCFSAPNPIKNKMVDEVDELDRNNNEYKEIDEIIEEMSETEQDEAVIDQDIRILKEKHKQLKNLIRMLNHSDLVCLYLMPNLKYAFGLKLEKDIEIISEISN